MVAYFCFFFSRWSCCWSRDWLRFARPSLVGSPLQEISKHLTVFTLILFFCATNYYHILNGRIFLLFLAGGLVVGVGIGFASLAHPCLVILCKKSATTYRCLHLIFVSYLLVSELPAAIKRKSGATFVVPDFLRRERDFLVIFFSPSRETTPCKSMRYKKRPLHFSPPDVRILSATSVIFSLLTVSLALRLQTRGVQSSCLFPLSMPVSSLFFLQVRLLNSRQHCCCFPQR